MILTNCVVLSLDDPTTQNDDSSRVSFELALLVFYTVEMVVKIGANGFFFGSQNAYIRDLWNVLDFTIIITGYLPYIFSTSSVNLNSVRSLRVLRPLRTISTIKALRQIISTLFNSLSLLKDAMFILLCFYLVFAIAGQQLFSGALKRRCFDVTTGIINANSLCEVDSDCNNARLVCGKGMDSPMYDI